MNEFFNQRNLLYVFEYIIDEDFAEGIMADRTGPAAVWLRIGNCTNSELLGWLLSLWPQEVEALENGERLVEVT